MARHARLRIDTGLPVYFCDPRSPVAAGGEWIVGSAHSLPILVIAVSVLIGVGINRVAVSRKRCKWPDA